MDKIEQWFKILNKKLEKVDLDVLSMREAFGELREFIEQHQTDIRLCKLAIERVDDKFESLRRHP